MEQHEDLNVAELLIGDPNEDRETIDRMVVAIYNELRALAEFEMAGERPGHTLQATALVHAALIRLLQETDLKKLTNKQYFFGAAAIAMRRILVEHARGRAATKRGGGCKRVALDEMLDDFKKNSIDLLTLNEALEAMEKETPRQNAFLNEHYFCGRSIKEIARDYRLSVETVRQEIRKAETWIAKYLFESEK
jgi:RNA polymerase sigma-70 factor, ECF subfamily